MGSSRASGRNASDKNLYLGGLLVLLSCFAVYWATRQHVFAINSDSALWFLRAQEGENIPVHPIKLFYYPVLYFLCKACALLGWKTNALAAIQMFSSVFGALCASLFFIFVYKVTHSSFIAGVVSLLLAFSNVIWKNFGEVESLSLSLFFLISCLLLLIVYTERRASTICLAAAALFNCLAVLFYLVHVFFIPVAIVTVLLTAHDGKKLRHVLIYCLILLFCVLPPYLLIWVFSQEGDPTITKFYEWVKHYELWRWGYFQFGMRTFVESWWGLANAIASTPRYLLSFLVGEETANSYFIFYVLKDVTLFFMFIAYFLPLVLGLKRAFAANRNCLIILSFLASYVLFSLCLSTSHSEMWITPLIPIWTAYGLSLRQMSAQAPGPKRWMRVAFPIVLFMVMFPTGLAGKIWRSNCKNNLFCRSAELGQTRCGENDLIVTDPMIVAHVYCAREIGDTVTGHWLNTSWLLWRAVDKEEALEKYETKIEEEYNHREETFFLQHHGQCQEFINLFWLFSKVSG